MERTLSLLRERAFLKDWSDAQILPGQSISEATRTKQSEADVVAFLFSPDFLASEECRREWDRAKEAASTGKLLFRVPIIVRPCGWLDFLGDDDVKALPLDGKAITEYDNRDSAWQEVYEGVKSVVQSLRATFTAKPAFLEDLNSADLPSSNPLFIDDIFVFPRLIERHHAAATGRLRESVISSMENLRSTGHAVIHGEDKSGKTALAKQLVLSLLSNGDPVLLVDLDRRKGRLDDRLLRGFYEDQFNGDYHLWQQQSGKILVIDNVTEAPGLLDFIALCLDAFSHICLFVSSDVYHSFFADDVRLIDFQEVRLVPLTPTQQETLIRKRLVTLNLRSELTDGLVDHVEDRVNSIIISNRIVPRYPFFVLSILQTFDAAMPLSLSISSYGHCYYVFILASLRRAGISEADDAIESCINFAKQLALAIYRTEGEGGGESLDFAAFIEQYRSDYFMEMSLLNRLTHHDFGIITKAGEFKTAYMYYFFLGFLLATTPKLAQKYLPAMCEHSDIEGNYLTLLFAIHHATDDQIIEDIMIRMLVDVEDLPVATLNGDETSRFSSIVKSLPDNILSDATVEQERAKERELREELDEERDVESTEQPTLRSEGSALRPLRVLKNNRILGQVLRNQHGKLKKTQIEEIVETVADSSFRLINLILKDDEEIRSLAQQIHEVIPGADRGEVQWRVRVLSFLWTITNIESAVQAVGLPSIREAVNVVVDRNDTPAYEVLGYFCQLDSSEKLTMRERDKLAALYRKHQDDFIRWVLSIRTQSYMNTHRSKASVAQSICAVLDIDYTPQLMSAGMKIS